MLKIWKIGLRMIIFNWTPWHIELLSELITNLTVSPARGSCNVNITWPSNLLHWHQMGRESIGDLGRSHSVAGRLVAGWWAQTWTGGESGSRRDCNRGSRPSNSVSSSLRTIDNKITQLPQFTYYNINGLEWKICQNVIFCSVLIMCHCMLPGWPHRPWPVITWWDFPRFHAHTPPPVLDGFRPGWNEFRTACLNYDFCEMGRFCELQKKMPWALFISSC